MADGYKATTDYADLSAEDKAIVDALIDAQNATGNVSAALESTSAVTVEYTPVEAEDDAEESAADDTVVEVGATHTIKFQPGDTNFINGLSWADWKTDAMEDGFKDSVAYTELSNFAMALIDSLITVQSALGDNSAEINSMNSGGRQIIEWTDEVPAVDITEKVYFEASVSDTTTVGGVTWTDLQVTAMDAGY